MIQQIPDELEEHLRYYRRWLTGQKIVWATLRADGTASSPLLLLSPLANHFKKLEPHSHSFTKSVNEDVGSAGTDHSIEITELASAEEMMSDYCDYIEKMLAALRVT